MRVGLLVAVVWGAVSACADDGLLAAYDFDEQAGSAAADGSGRGNDGTIHGPIRVDDGHAACLAFDGIDDYVDCGDRATLRPTAAVTLEAWVFPDMVPSGEPGIAGKHFNSFLLTYYSNGKVYWYIGGGGNNCQAVLAPGAWSHVAGTFDGQRLRLYIGGKLADERVSQHDTVNGAGRFLVGCVMGDPAASDPALTTTTHFPGKIDEVRVYDRALSAEEVTASFDSKAQRFVQGQYRVVHEGYRIGHEGLEVVAGMDGQLGIRTREGEYTIESAWSWPGDRIGWNAFGDAPGSPEEGWQATVRPVSGDAIEISAQGVHYGLSRRAHVKDDFVEIVDTLTNVGSEPVGILADHAVTAPEPFSEVVVPGGAECAVVFVRGSRDALALVVEDDVSRRKFQGRTGTPAAAARFRVGNLALDPGKSYTLRWSLRVLPSTSSYLDLANRLRREWNAVFTLEGPLDWFDVGARAELLNDPQALKAYFERKKQGLVLLMPWLDYDPGSFDHVWPRDEYKRRMQDAAQRIRAANAGGKVLGCIETDWVAIYPETIPGGEKLPHGGSGNIRLTPEQTRVLLDAKLPHLDSVQRDVEGNLTFEAYNRGGKPQASLRVYPAEGNSQAAFLMDQVRFLIDEVGLDGFYIDEFSQAFREDLRDYSGWDGISAEIDLRTGSILHKYVDCSLAGIEARVALCRYALDRGKVVVANTYATSMAEQSLPVHRFSETQASFNPFAAPEGVKPPLVVELLRGSLASPVGLGILPQRTSSDTAETLTRAFVTYLRHGMVMDHYALGDVPPDQGEYGPLNQAFPLTPVELYEGGIVGKERVITCVSGTFSWSGDAEPVVYVFDLRGRLVGQKPDVEWHDGEQRVTLTLEDWKQIGVIERWN